MARVDAYAAAWALVGAATTAALLLLWSVGGKVEPVSCTICCGGLLATVAVHLVYTHIRPEPFIASAVGGLACVAWAGAAAGVISLMALRTGAGLIDPVLARSDLALGLHMPAIVEWVARIPGLGHLLAVAYLSSFPLLFGTVLFLAFSGRRERLWELCLAFAGCITVCTLVSAFAPAIGAFSYYGIPEATLGLLPEGSGLYHRPVFDAYRSGAVSAVDFSRLQGVVTFPSFHTCLALMSAHALRGVPVVAGPAWLWNGVVIASTIPIGGHYGIDLIAGALVWGGFRLLSLPRRGAHCVGQLAQAG